MPQRSRSLLVIATAFVVVGLAHAEAPLPVTVPTTPVPGTRADPAVARVVAETAAALPPPHAPPVAGQPDETMTAVLDSRPRRCSVVEGVVALGLVATCMASSHCSGTSLSAPPARSCEVIRTKDR